jgi:hypothetical protein
MDLKRHIGFAISEWYKNYFMNPEDQSKRQTRIKVKDNYVDKLNTIEKNMIENIAPPELIVLRERGEHGCAMEYKDTDETIKCGMN